MYIAQPIHFVTLPLLLGGLLAAQDDWPVILRCQTFYAMMIKPDNFEK